MSDPRFSAMLLCLAISVFSITLNGQLRKNFGDALFGFLGIFWVAVSIAVFIAFGWKIGVLCLAGSYFLGVVLTPIAGMIAGLIRGGFPRE